MLRSAPETLGDVATLLAQVSAKAAAICDSPLTIEGVDASLGAIPSREEDRRGYRSQLVVEKLGASNQLGFGQAQVRGHGSSAGYYNFIIKTQSN